MNKILNIKQAVQVAKELREHKKSIVLVGGCFDILHKGHIEFLRRAKEQGDILFIFLENDESIRKIKGKNRPVNTQTDRAVILSELSIVDYVIMLPLFKTNQEYDILVIGLKPDIIATTKGDKDRNHKERVAKLLNVKVVDVIQRIPNRSTTIIIESIKNNL